MYAIFEKLCQRKGVTPYRVSKDTGISTATLSDWKTGKSHPKEDKIQILADYFDVSPDYIRTGTEKPYFDLNENSIRGFLKVLRTVNPEIDFNEEGLELIDLVGKYRKLSREDRDEIMNAIDFKLSRYKEKEREDFA